MTMYLRPLGRGISALGLIAPLALSALSACNNDPESGGLTINYTFATGVSCTEDQENVLIVEANVGEGGASGSQTGTCDNAGGDLVLAGVPAGAYDLIVRGLDDEGDAVLDNLGDELMGDDRVEIIGGDSKTVDVVLGLAPARLEVRFQVTIDDFGVQCTSEMITIKGLRVQAFDNLNAELLKTHDFDLCDFDGYLPVPDEDREISGRRFDTVVVQPIDGSGSPVGAQLELDLGGPIGAGKLAQIDISCEDTDLSCNGQVLGGDVGMTSATGDPTGGDPTGDPTGGDTTDGGDDTTTGGGGDTTTG